MARYPNAQEQYMYFVQYEVGLVSSHKAGPIGCKLSDNYPTTFYMFEDQERPSGRWLTAPQ
jgi:hypothetical protein